MTNTLNQPKQFTRKDIQQQVTDTIIQQLEKGTIPWKQPWKGTGLPVNYTTGNKYRGVNVLLLWSSAIQNEFTSMEWGTFKQWTGKDETIRKGEKGSLIVYYDTFEKEVDGEMKNIPFLKSSIVFNKCQLNSYQKPELINLDNAGLTTTVKAIDEFVENTKATIQHSYLGACYNPSQDKIYMPYPEYFEDTNTCTATEGYYSTLLHELTHWTGGKDRIERTKGKKFEDVNYALEELVAEMGAAFLCSEFGIETLEKEDHSGYIAYWLKVLKDNKQCIFTASSEASKAVDFLHGLQPQ
ncbi:MAG: zincin-like metallopeptidase domain-containing protein [Bacteroidota bacterium]